MSELSSGWKHVTIGEIANYVQRGKSPNYTEKSELPIVNQKSVRWWGIDEKYLKFVHPDQWEAWSNERFLKPGDILWNSTGTGTIGRAALFNGVNGYNKVVVDSHVTIVRCSERCLPRYLHYYIQSPMIQGRIEEMYTGSTNQVELSREEVLRTPLPLPPLPEQRRIVAKLDNLFAKSRRARQELSHIPRLVEHYKQAILRTAFNGVLTEKISDLTNLQEAKTESNYHQILTAPQYWKKLTLGEVCQFVGGSQPPKSQFSYEPQEGYIRLIQIRDYKTEAYKTFIPLNLARRFCTKEDIMIGRYGPPIFQILEGLEGAYNVALMKAIPDINIVNRDFLFYYLQHPTLRTYVEIDAERTAGQDGVNKDQLLKFPIFVPSLEKQAQISNKIKSAFAHIDKLAIEAAHATALLDRLDQATLAKAFRGELVTHETAEPPPAPPARPEIYQTTFAL